MVTRPTTLPLDDDVAGALSRLAEASEHGLNAILRDALQHELRGASAASSDAILPVPYTFAAGLAADLLHPGSSPPGANDWSRRPSAAHPRPVVLVHGLFANMTNTWQAAAPLLTNNGYAVYALTYGLTDGTQFGGRAPIADDAAQIATFVDRVLEATGADQVDIVGHSLGGLVPRYFIEALGGAPKVHTFVGLAPATNGTTVDGVATLAGKLGIDPSTVPVPDCPSCDEVILGSAFLRSFNARPETVPGVSYTVIVTRYDEAVTPYESGFISGEGVTNIVVQNHCKLDFSEHLSLPYDPVALHLVLNALDPAHATSPPCVFVPPFVG